MQRILKLVATILIILFFGVFGIIFFFADFGPGETWLSRLSVAFGYFAFFGGIITLLNYPKTKRAYFLLWFLVMAAVLNFKTTISEGIDSILGALAMVAIPFVAILFVNYAIFSWKNRVKKRSGEQAPTS